MDLEVRGPVVSSDYCVVMAADRVWTAAEMEVMTPDERARLVEDGFRDSLDGLDPGFGARVEEKSRRIVWERELLDSEHS